MLRDYWQQGVERTIVPTADPIDVVKIELDVPVELLQSTLVHSLILLHACYRGWLAHLALCQQLILDIR
jgi:hypothetical protein